MGRTGKICLLQFSDREQDWLLDAYVLSDPHSNGWKLLSDLFSNPGILKVMHGADHDVRWLQRDFHIEIVNLFDTGQAMRILAYERASLAHLLMVHLDIHVEKTKFQNEDWRVRPLGSEINPVTLIVDTHH